MPQDYEKLKRRLLREGMPLREAKRVAAIQTNRTRKRQGRPPARFHR